jgi:hypothetical protein
MTTMQISVECGDCGAVPLKLPDLMIRVCADNEQWSFCFLCPECRRATAYDSSAQALDLLVTLGAPVKRWHLPAELTESRPGGPVLTADDLLDFHLFLQRTDWFDPTTPGS